MDAFCHRPSSGLAVCGLGQGSVIGDLVHESGASLIWGIIIWMSCCTMPYGLPGAWKRPRRIPSITVLSIYSSLGNARTSLSFLPLRISLSKWTLFQRQLIKVSRMLWPSFYYFKTIPASSTRKHTQCRRKPSTPSTRRELFIADRWPSPQASVASASKEQTAPGSDA